VTGDLVSLISEVRAWHNLDNEVSSMFIAMLVEFMQEEW
jgi:hypothetical protein